MSGTKVVLAVDAICRPLTGIGRYAFELATRLPTVSSVDRVKFFSLGSWVADPVRLLDSPPLTHAGRSTLAGMRLAQAAYHAFAPYWFGRQLRDLKEHLYHSPNFFLPGFRGCRVATFHDLSVFVHPDFHPPERVGFMQREITASLRRADFLITDSEFTRTELIDQFSWPAGRIRAVPLGVSEAYHPRPPEHSASTLSRLGLAHGAYALCVATIEPRKNIDGLLTAYSRLPDRLRRQYPLVLAGGRGWRSDATHAHILQAVREGWAKYLGYVDEADLPVLYAGARGFVFPSFYEGFGLPVLEAMASGIPVLCSDRASLPEVAGGAGLLVNPQDGDALRMGIERLLEDDVWRASAVAQARAISARFTWQRTAEETAGVYRDAIIP
jgi:alpha-1,3-rhamnosyl/mannosyltransferase